MSNEMSDGSGFSIFNFPILFLSFCLFPCYSVVMTLVKAESRIQLRKGGMKFHSTQRALNIEGDRDIDLQAVKPLTSL